MSSDIEATGSLMGKAPEAHLRRHYATVIEALAEWIMLGRPGSENESTPRTLEPQGGPAHNQVHTETGHLPA